MQKSRYWRLYPSSSATRLMVSPTSRWINWREEVVMMMMMKTKTPTSRWINWREEVVMMMMMMKTKTPTSMWINWREEVVSTFHVSLSPESWRPGR